MLTFQNTENTFKGISSRQLCRTIALFGIAEKKIVLTSLKLAIGLLNKYHIPYPRIISKHISGQLWGGSTIDQCVATANKLWEKRIYSTIDDYPSPYSKINTEEYFNSVVALLGRTTETPKIAFFTLNLKHLIEPRILKLLMDNGMVNRSDRIKYERFKEQVWQLCKLAYKHNKPIIIEPINPSSQAIINHISENMMMEFNKEEAIVYASLHMSQMNNTIFLHQLHQNATKYGFIAGVKLVKGDQFAFEPRLTDEELFNYDSSAEIQRALTDAIKFCLSNIDTTAAIYGTHSEQNIIYALSLMENMHIAPSNKHIFFTQLLGLGNNISLTLANNGFNVVKILPFGNSKLMLPYFFRNIQNNPSVQEQSIIEKELIISEIKRRKLAEKETT